MAFCGTKKAVLLFFVTITRLEDYKWEQQKRGWDKSPTSNIKSEQNRFVRFSHLIIDLKGLIIKIFKN